VTRAASSAPRPEYVIDRAASRAVDRAAFEEYGLPSIVLMENAAVALREEALALLAPGGEGRDVVIVAGGGNNGGDGWALARHLHNAGAAPLVVVLGEPKAGGDAAINASVCRRMGVRETTAERLSSIERPRLVVDAIFGTGLDRPVTGRAADAIAWIGRAGAPVLAVDAPSGLDADSGRPLGPCVEAAVTVTFAAVKRGFLEPDARRYVGRVVVADIGIPRALLDRLATRL